MSSRSPAKLAIPYIWSVALLPDAEAGLVPMRSLELARNLLVGRIPEAVALLSKMDMFSLGTNQLAGSIPEAVGEMKRMATASFQSNILASHIPGIVRFLKGLNALFVARNRLSGALPHECGGLRAFDIFGNDMTGSPLDWALLGTRGGSQDLILFSASWNHLAGALPGEMVKLTRLGMLFLGRNLLKGTLPDLPLSAVITELCSNELAGSIPWLYPGDNLAHCRLDKNQLTGIIPSTLMELTGLLVLTCSGNAFEGSLPPWRLQSCDLELLDISGKPGAAEHMQGPFPLALQRASHLSKLLAHHQMLEGAVPGLCCSLQILVLHCNRLKALSDQRFASKEWNAPSCPLILLHQNLLSCDPPGFGGASANFSLAALGNRFWQPRHGHFPKWIAPFEKDGLLWVSNREGLLLGIKFLASAAFFVAILMKKQRSFSWRVVAMWQAAGGCQGLLAQVMMSEASLLMKATLWGACFFMALLLCWDVYKCPGTLALASACLRESAIVNLIVVFFWIGLNACSRRGSWWLLRRASLAGSSTPRGVARRCVSVVVWFPIILLLSTLAALDQAGKSVPGFFFLNDGGAMFTKAISSCIGAIQSLTICVVLPSLADSVIPGMRSLLGLASLLVTCIFPSLVIVYFDDACMAQWKYFWLQCSAGRAEQFNVVAPRPDNSVEGIMVLNKGDICRTRGQASPSGCVQVALLRLQDILLGKWIASSLVVPAGKVLCQRHNRDPVKLVQQVSLAMEVAVLTSGPLPLLTPILVVAVLSKMFLASLAWEKRLLRAWSNESMGTLSWISAQLFSGILYCVFTAGDGLAFLIFALASLYLAGRSGAPRWRLTTTQSGGRRPSPWHSLGHRGSRRGWHFRR